MAADLPGFSSFDFAQGGITHTVYSQGEGPSVLIMHELPGLSPAAVHFGGRLVKEGFQVHLPLLFGTPMQRDARGAYKQLCVSQEFARLQAGVSAPITDWLRALARELSRRSGRPVGAIGMCLTGAFAIPLILEPTVGAHVAAQPGCPFSLAYRITGLGRGPWMSQLNISDDDLNLAATRAAASGLTLLALRFDTDRICPRERMVRLQHVFGAQLELHELKDTNVWRTLTSPPHATLTEEYDKAPERPDEPTRQAFAHLLEFLHARLT